MIFYNIFFLISVYSFYISTRFIFHHKIPLLTFIFTASKNYCLHERGQSHHHECTGFCCFLYLPTSSVDSSGQRTSTPCKSLLDLSLFLLRTQIIISRTASGPAAAAATAGVTPQQWRSCWTFKRNLNPH